MSIVFTPKGKTGLIAASVTAPLGLLIPVDIKFTNQEAGEYRISNVSATIIFLGVGTTALEAQNNAVEPLAGIPSLGIPFAPGAVEIMRFPLLSFFSGKSSAGATLYMTPGEGI